MAPRNSPILTDFSHELLCHILQYLPLKKVLSISMLCKKLRYAVDMHLRLCKEIDLCEGKIYDYMPSTITDDHMHALLKRCPHLETVYGLHPLKVERRRLRKRSALTVPGIIEALCLCCNLKSVETSDLRLLEAIMHHLPQVDIIGHFQNRDGVFPPHASQRLKLLPYPRISSLHLIGVEVPELTAMPHLHHLHLQCVRFTKLQPFRAFLAQNLKTFVMKHCMGPSLSLRYLSLIIALSSSPSLSRLELVRVPLPGGLFQRAVEDSYRHNGFVNLKTLVISGCKGVLESDLGHLMIVSSKNLESISIQPSLTRDSLFVSLSFANCEFPKLKSLHLGYVDKLNAPGEWTNDTLLSIGLADIPDTPSSLTDSGMKVISQLFPNIKSMSVSNCPHLMAMDQWSAIDGEQQVWKELTDLTLQRCHCLQLPSFALFLAFLPKIEVVILNDMFREPPKGCSHVGLSAGTGLGMSSAVVSNQDEHIAVQGHHHQEFELHPDDPLDGGMEDDEFIDGDNAGEENPDQHIMVLQQEFFDEENQIARVAQREDVLPVGNVPENQIRRELNADYRAESSDDASPLSTSDGGDIKTAKKRNRCYVRRMSRKRRKRSERRSRASGFSSDEDVTLPSTRKISKKGKRVDGDSRASAAEEKDCRHDKKCRKNCSKGFDPDKPSTSKDGNCFDCRCGSELREPLAASEPEVRKRSRVPSSSDGEPTRKKSNLDKAASCCSSDLGVDQSEKITDEKGGKCSSLSTRDHCETLNSDTQEAESMNQSIVINTEQSPNDERCTVQKGGNCSSPFMKDPGEMFNSFAQEPESLHQYDVEHVEKKPEEERCADEKDESCCSPLTRDCSEMLNSHAQEPESLNQFIIESNEKLPEKEKSTDEKSEKLSSPLAEGHRELLNVYAQEPESLNQYNIDHVEKKPEGEMCVDNEDESCSGPLTRDQSEMLNVCAQEPESLNQYNIDHVEKKPVEEMCVDNEDESCSGSLTRDQSEMLNVCAQKPESLNQYNIDHVEKKPEDEMCVDKDESCSGPFTRDQSEMLNVCAQKPESLNQYNIDHVEKKPEDEMGVDNEDESCSGPLTRDQSEMLNVCAQEPESLNQYNIDHVEKKPEDEMCVDKDESCSGPFTRDQSEMLNVCAQEPESLNQYKIDQVEKKLKDEMCADEKDECCSSLTRDHEEMLNSPESLNHSNIEHIEKKPADELFIDEKGESCSLEDPSSEVLISDIQKPEFSNQFNIEQTKKKSTERLSDERGENYSGSLTTDQSEVLHLGSEEPESSNVLNTEQSEKKRKADSLYDQNESSNESSIECYKQKVFPISDSDCKSKDSSIIAMKDVGIVFDFPGRIKSEPESLPSSPQKYPMDFEDESIELNMPNDQNIDCGPPVEIAHSAALALSPSQKDIVVMPDEMMECGTLNDSNINCDLSVEMESEPELDVSSRKDPADGVENVSMECSETNDAIMKDDVSVEMEVSSSQVEQATKDNSKTDQSLLVESEPLSSIPPSDKDTSVVSQDTSCCETKDLDMGCELPLVEESPSELVSELQTDVLVNIDESSEHGSNGKQTIGCNPAAKESPSESISELQAEVVLVNKDKSSEHSSNGTQTIGCDPAVDEPAESSSDQKETTQDKSVPSGRLYDDRTKENHQPPSDYFPTEPNCGREEEKTLDSKKGAFESKESKKNDDQSNSCDLSPEASPKSNSPVPETIVVRDDSMEDYKPNDHNYCSLDVEIKSEPESVPSPSPHVHPDVDEPQHGRDSELGFPGPVRIKSEPESLPPSPGGEVDDQAEEAGPSRRRVDPDNLDQIMNAAVKSECESEDDSPNFPENNAEPELPTRRQNHTRIIDCHCCFEIKSECESVDSSPENADSKKKNPAGSQAHQGEEPSAACSSQIKSEAAESQVQEGDGNDKKSQTPPRKRNPPRICKRASRALTKKQRRRIGRSGYNLVSQGTQATSADIRRSLRRLRSCLRRTNPDSTGTTTTTTTTVRYSRVSCRQVIKRKTHPKPNVVTHNKSTSTSDPLMEDDAVQTLRLVSETLISLTIISCGISDVVIDHCHSLTHVEVQACRILKMFQLHYCPALKRIGISQCPKLMLESITPEVVSLVATRKMIIYYEPCMQKYSSPRCEKAVFSKTPLDQGIILFQDYTSVNNESQQAAFKEYLFKWMEVVQKLYYSPLLAKQKKKKTKPKEIKSKFPYGHNLIRLHGVYTLPRSIDPIGTTWRYQILTNDHVFASALEKVPWDKGFPPPDIAEAYREDSALLSMIETELHEKNLKTQKKLTTFYIPTYENSDCDL